MFTNSCPDGCRFNSLIDEKNPFESLLYHFRRRVDLVFDREIKPYGYMALHLTLLMSHWVDTQAEKVTH